MAVHHHRSLINEICVVYTRKWDVVIIIIIICKVLKGKMFLCIFSLNHIQNIITNYEEQNDDVRVDFIMGNGLNINFRDIVNHC